MKIKLMIVLSVIFATGIGAIIVFIPLKQQKDKLAQEARFASKTAQNYKEKVASLQKEEAGRLEEIKIASLAQKQTGPVYFDYKITPISGNKEQVDIYLRGEKNTSVDATDLVFSYGPTVQIDEIKKGTAFPSYPRALAKDNTVTITGIALPMGGTITYGKIDQLFASVVVTKTVGAKLELNTKDTLAYFEGAPILDFTRTFKEIGL